MRHFISKAKVAGASAFVGCTLAACGSVDQGLEARVEACPVGVGTDTETTEADAAVLLSERGIFDQALDTSSESNDDYVTEVGEMVCIDGNGNIVYTLGGLSVRNQARPADVILDSIEDRASDAIDSITDTFTGTDG